MSLSQKTIDKFVDGLVQNWNSVVQKISAQARCKLVALSRVDQGSEYSGQRGKFSINVQQNVAGPASHEKLATIVVDKNKPMSQSEAGKAIKAAFKDAGLS